MLFTDRNVRAYKAETIRIMFNKDLVPNGNKNSLVNGKDYILKYEEMMANNANAERENRKLGLINEASQSVIDLEESPSMYWYNKALSNVNKLEDSTDKNQFLQRIDDLKETVNNDWKEDIEYEIERLSRSNYRYLSRTTLKSLEKDISEGFDEELKIKYNKSVELFKNILNIRDEKIRNISRTSVIVVYIILSIIIAYELVKVIKEKKAFKGKYYREFPGDYSPYIIEYIMKGKITNLSISATILDLIAKKVIKLEEIPGDKKDAKLILNKQDELLTVPEVKILDILFNLVGNNDVCTLKELKNYGKTEHKARALKNKIDKFKSEAKKEAKNKSYFKSSIITILIKILIIIIYIFSLFMTTGIFKNMYNAKEILLYITEISCIAFICYYIVNKDKNRNQEGKEEYSKWLAHKRYLKDFSKFDEKDLPEIALWEKYLVTATILGCADKVQSKMKLYINNSTEISHVDYYLLSSSLNNDFVKTINKSVNNSISTANSTINVSSSSSSGGGYGGGSSFGGGRRPEEEAAEVVSKNQKSLKLKIVSLSDFFIYFS